MYDDGPSWVVTEDRLQLKLIVPTAPGMDIGFDAAGADAMLATVAGLRAGMAPSVDLAANPDPKRLTATFGAWLVVSDQKGGVVLATAHPDYGWVAIALEPQTIADLVRELIAISDPEAHAFDGEPPNEHAPWKRGS